MPARKTSRTKPDSALPRRPGRPSTTAAGPDARERLVDIALQLFAAQGIAATPLSAVARAAKVTPALLHYYFGNKDKLVDALVEERLQPLVAQVGFKLAATDAHPRQAIETFVREIVNLLAAHAWLPQLWLREVLSEGGQLRERVLDRFAPMVAARVHELARKAQRGRKLNRDLDPRLLMVSLIGLTVFPFAAQPIWRRLYDADDVTPQVLIRHVLGLLLRGLELPDE